MGFANKELQMQEPDKPDEKGLKGLDLDKFGKATEKLVGHLSKKSLLKRMKDALTATKPQRTS
jgi:hypothetical protein